MPINIGSSLCLSKKFENNKQRKTAIDSYRWNTRSSSGVKSLPPEKTEKSNDKPKVTTRWEKGKCFKCQEPWVPGHNKICKFKNQFHLISIQDEDTSEEGNTKPTPPEEDVTIDDSPELQISLHALSGTSSHAQIFPLFIHIGTLKLVALVDTSSTASFIDPIVIAKASIQVTNHDPLKVTMANGNILWTQALTTNCPYTIQGHNFSSDFRILEL
jgi:hypothetical protein